MSSSLEGNDWRRGHGPRRCVFRTRVQQVSGAGIGSFWHGPPCKGASAIWWGPRFSLGTPSLDASREFLGKILGEVVVERGRRYLHVAPGAPEVLGAPEVHLVQGGLGGLGGLGCQPGPVHPVVC